MRCIFRKYSGKMNSKVFNASRIQSRREAAIHVHIGMQIKRARGAAGLSEQALAGKLGVAVPRLQAIEDGSERLTARGLFDIAQILGRSVSYFFEDLDVEPSPVMTTGGATNESRTARLAETNALIAAFYRIPDIDTRRDVIRLVRGIAEDL